jgi:hypothetical protein
MDRKENSLILGNIKIDNITQRTVSILGGKRAGKTTTLKMLALNSPVPIYIFDPLHIIPAMDDFDKITIYKKDVKKGKEAGIFLNKIDLGKRKGVIFSFMELLQDEQAEFTDNLFKVWSPRNCIIALDEVHEFTPEHGMKMEYGAEIERAVRHWGNKNVGFIITSQRSAFVSKKVLGLTDFLILFRMTHTADIEAVKDLLKEMNQPVSKQIISQLQTKDFLKGYAIDFRKHEFNKNEKVDKTLEKLEKIDTAKEHGKISQHQHDVQSRKAVSELNKEYKPNYMKVIPETDEMRKNKITIIRQ